jgi:SAM-dependent methyltransferase
MKDQLLKLLGWQVTTKFGDPLVMDRWRWIKSRLKHGPLRTFDAGCGNGCFSFAAAAAGNIVVGGSYDAAPLKKASYRSDLFGFKDVHFEQIDLRELSSHARRLGKFDQIICTECIEHIFEDERLVRDLAELLKPGGQLLLTTPHSDHKPLRFEELSKYEDGGHVRWGYTEDRLNEIFEKAGLDVVEVSLFSGWISQSLTSLMRGKHERIAWMITYPLRIFQIFDGPLTHILTYPWFAIGVVASKPLD